MVFFNIFKGPERKNAQNKSVMLDPVASKLPYREGRMYLTYDEDVENPLGHLYVDISDDRRIMIGSDRISSGSSGDISVDTEFGLTHFPTAVWVGADELLTNDETIQSMVFINDTENPLFTPEKKGIYSDRFCGVLSYDKGIPYASINNFTYDNLIQNSVFYIPRIISNKYIPAFGAESEKGVWSFGTSAQDTLSFYYADRPETNVGTSTEHGVIHFAPDGTIFASALYTAIGNDVAEYRDGSSDLQVGECVIEAGNGEVIKSTERLQPGGSIISDTFGLSVGSGYDAAIPLAIAGRALAYPYEDKTTYHIGDTVCTGPNGTISKMTREEIQQYPDRIVGIVSEIPDYEIWHDVNVNGRIWIKL